MSKVTYSLVDKNRKVRKMTLHSREYRVGHIHAAVCGTSLNFNNLDDDETVN
jgi:hypothetical protein